MKINPNLAYWKIFSMKEHLQVLLCALGTAFDKSGLLSLFHWQNNAHQLDSETKREQSDKTDAWFLNKALTLTQSKCLEHLPVRLRPFTNAFQSQQEGHH